MDKVLAFSILSASPADIAAGSGGRWARLSWRRGKQDDQAGQMQPGDRPAEAEKQRDTEGSHSQQRRRRPREEMMPRVALEFDGIDCFETIVSH